MSFLINKYTADLSKESWNRKDQPQKQQRQLGKQEEGDKGQQTVEAFVEYNCMSKALRMHNKLSQDQ